MSHFKAFFKRNRSSRALSRHWPAVLITLTLSLLVQAFQNCGGVHFNSDPVSVSSDSASPGNSTSVPESLPEGTPVNVSQIQQTLHQIKPAFAVRGMNCTACHGVFGSDLITDFGTSTNNNNNFAPTVTYDSTIAAVPFMGLRDPQTISTVLSRTAYNNGGEDPDGTGHFGGWLNVTINGSIHVPAFKLAAKLTPSQLQGLALPSTPIINTLADLVGMLQPEINIVEHTSIQITYPSATDLAPLLAAGQLKVGTPGAAAINSVQASKLTGLSVDATGKYMTNSSTVSCYGDVIVEGPLLLNNLNLQTDSAGCRLYVDGTVFVQGPITYVGAVVSDEANGQYANLQISSDIAIIMGLSSTRLGARSDQTQGVRIANPSDNLNQLAILETAASCEYTRFDQFDETQFSPSGNIINGYGNSGHDYFDKIVRDSLLIGNKLVSASDAQTVTAALQNSLGPDVSIVNDQDKAKCPEFTAAASGNASVQGLRLHINYRGLLLNAPHVHSFYGGTIKGVVIADVALLARNLSAGSTQVQQFFFDPLFDSTVNSKVNILPAIKDVLVVK